MEDWSYQPAPDLQESIAERLRRFPRYPEMWMYATRSVLHLGLRLFLKAFHRLKISGRENIPESDSMVMICNHASHLDALCLLSSLPLRRLHRAFPAAASDYFFSSLARSLVSTVFVNGLPFDRFDKGEESLEMCRQLLDRPGNILIIFPEGTRSTDGEISRFRSGIARIVAGTEIPVVPCYLSGAAKAWPKGAAVPRPRPLELHIGSPRVYPNCELNNRKDAEFICEELRSDVIELSNGS